MSSTIRRRRRSLYRALTTKSADLPFHADQVFLFEVQLGFRLNKFECGRRRPYINGVVPGAGNAI